MNDAGGRVPVAAIAGIVTSPLAVHRGRPASRYGVGVHRLLATLVLAGSLALGAAPAGAQDVFDDFRDDGRIDPCQYSDEQLDVDLPPDVQQYSPGLADQLASGREGCGVAGGPGAGEDTRQVETLPAPATAGGGGGGRGGSAAPRSRIRVPAPPAPKSSRRRLADLATPPVSLSAGSDVPGWLLPILVGLALGGAMTAAIRIGGVSAERFTAPWRAAFEEAGGRTADAGAQLRESLRFGR